MHFILINQVLIKSQGFYIASAGIFRSLRCEIILNQLQNENDLAPQRSKYSGGRNIKPLAIYQDLIYENEMHLVTEGP